MPNARCVLKCPRQFRDLKYRKCQESLKKMSNFFLFNLISLFSYSPSGFQRTTSYRRPKAALVPGSDLGLLALLLRLGHTPAPDYACCSHWPVVLVSFPQARKGFILACRLQSVIRGGDGGRSRTELKSGTKVETTEAWCLLTCSKSHIQELFSYCPGPSPCIGMALPTMD